MNTYMAAPLAFLAGYLNTLADSSEINSFSGPIYTQGGLLNPKAIRISLSASEHDAVTIRRDLEIGQLTATLQVYDTGEQRDVYSGGFRLNMHSKASEDWKRSGEFMTGNYLLCDLPTYPGALLPRQLGQRVAREVIHYLSTAKMPSTGDIAQTLKGYSPTWSHA